MRALVTGATGFLGRFLVQELINNNYQLTILARETSDTSVLQQYSNLEVKIADLTKKKSLKKALDDEIEVIFHNAAAVDEWGKYRYFHENNVIGTKNLFEEAIKHRVKKFVYTSTAAMYEYDEERELTEDEPKMALNNYQKSKIAAEEWLFTKAALEGIAVTAVRPPGIIGPGNNYMVSRLAIGLANEKVPMIGSGEKKQSYVDSRDTAYCLRLAAETSLSDNEAFNVKSFDVSAKDYWLTAAEILDKDIEFIHYPYPIAYFFAILSESWGKLVKKKRSPQATRFRVNYFGKQFLLDITKAEQKLHYKPKYNFAESMKEMFEYWQNKEKANS
jgi:nucleoside-diphosphate-sugar epimerase